MAGRWIRDLSNPRTQSHRDVPRAITPRPSTLGWINLVSTSQPRHNIYYSLLWLPSHLLLMYALQPTCNQAAEAWACLWHNTLEMVHLINTGVESIMALKSSVLYYLSLSMDCKSLKKYIILRNLDHIGEC